eukprot:6682350-Pyramimonas_sp.AAC.1
MGPHLALRLVDWSFGADEVPADVPGAVREWFNNSEAWLGVFHDVPDEQRGSYMGRGLGLQLS